MCKHDYRQTLLVFIALIMSLQPTLSRAQVPGDLPALTVLVRHAERASAPADDPPLTPAGIKRAQDLAATLRDTKFSAIVTTHLIRTRDTAAPTATALGLTPESVIVKDLPPDAHAKAIENAVRNHRGGVVLVVNHSNVLAAIIARLGGPQFPNICEAVYDHLFALIPAAGRVQFVSSRYGDVSPPPQPGCM
jgi:phosphohistidine phosphatase SixA